MIKSAESPAQSLSLLRITWRPLQKWWYTSVQISRAWQKQIRCLESKGKYAESSTTSSGHWTFTYHKALCSLSPLAASPLLSRVAKGNFRETGGGGEVEGRWSHLVHLWENLKRRERDYKSHWIRNREHCRVTRLFQTKLQALNRLQKSKSCLANIDLMPIL